MENRTRVRIPSSMRKKVRQPFGCRTFYTVELVYDFLCFAFIMCGVRFVSALRFFLPSAYFFAPTCAAFSSHSLRCSSVLNLTMLKLTHSTFLMPTLLNVSLTSALYIASPK